MQGFDDSHTRGAAAETEQLHQTRLEAPPEGFGRTQLIGLAVLVVVVFAVYLLFRFF